MRKSKVSRLYGLIVCSKAMVRTLLLGSVLFIISGCTSSHLVRPMEDFATATDSAATDFEKQIDKVLETRVEDRKKQLAKKITVQSIAIQKGDCKEDSERCRLIITGGENDETTPYLHTSFHTDFDDVKEILQFLKNYVADIKSVAEAKTGEQVEGNVTKALSSVALLSEAIAKKEAAEGETVETKLTPLKGDAGGAIAWMIGEAAEAAKINALKDLIQQANSIVQRVAKALGAILDEAVAIEKRVVEQDIEDILTKLENPNIRPKDKQKVINSSLELSLKMDNLLKIQPSKLLDQMARAHNALYEASKSTDSSEFLKTVGKFVTEAGKIKKAFAKKDEKKEDEQTDTQ